MSSTLRGNDLTTTSSERRSGETPNFILVPIREENFDEQHVEQRVLFECLNRCRLRAAVDLDHSMSPAEYRMKHVLSSDSVSYISQCGQCPFWSDAKFCHPAQPTDRLISLFQTSASGSLYSLKWVPLVASLNMGQGESFTFFIAHSIQWFILGKFGSAGSVRDRLKFYDAMDSDREVIKKRKKIDQEVILTCKCWCRCVHLRMAFPSSGCLLAIC